MHAHACTCIKHPPKTKLDKNTVLANIASIWHPCYMCRLHTRYIHMYIYLVYCVMYIYIYICIYIYIYIYT